MKQILNELRRFEINANLDTFIHIFDMDNKDVSMAKHLFAKFRGLKYSILGLYGQLDGTNRALLEVHLEEIMRGVKQWLLRQKPLH